MTKRVRWACPNGCAAVLGPSKPRRDDVVRYCLKCSATKGRLVLRKAPALEAKRSARAARARVKVTQEKEREKRDETAYYEVHGVDTRAELRRLWSLPVAVEYRKSLPATQRIKPPELTIRNRVAAARTYGVAFTFQHRILINRIEGQSAMIVRETLAHELAHILTPAHGHDHVWKHVLRLLCEQAYGMKPTNDNRFIGSLASTVVVCADHE